MKRDRVDFRGRASIRFPLPSRGRPDGRFVVAEVLDGRYQVDDLLAAGDYTVILKARDLRTRSDVLIKAVRPDALPPCPPEIDPIFFRTGEIRRLRHGLQTERRLLVRLRNLGIACVPIPRDHIYDLNPDLDEIEPGMADKEPYLVLERLPGRTLDRMIANEFPRGMPAKKAVPMLLPIVEAIAALHEPWRHPSGSTWHVVYADLKPANVMISYQGHASLLDFGGCQVIVDGIMALHGSTTPGYAPPEADGPPRPLLACADVFMIGATLWHMLTAVDPTTDRVGPPLDPGRLPRSAPAPLRKLIAECLSPRPSDRPASARIVAERLASAVPAPRGAS